MASDRAGPCAGRILRVDLSNGTTEIRDSAELAERFLGGRGLASALYWDEVPATGGVDDEANCLILAVGPLCGIPGGLGGSRWGIFGKSPLPAADRGGRHHFCYGNLGGGFGAELRAAGWDAVLIRGRAQRPVVLAVSGDGAAIEPAGELWGRSAPDSLAALGNDRPDGPKAMAIGPAGEHGAVMATVFADGDASCSGGMGAVMGAKQLKAVTVRGAGRRVPVADRARLKALISRIRAMGRGNVKVWGLDFMPQGPKTRRWPCWGCMGHCLRVRYTAADGTSGKFMCQSRFFYLPLAWDHYGCDNDVPFLANRLCDDYGVDTWEIQALLDWLLRCHAEGVLDGVDTGLDFAQAGSLRFIQDLVRMVALRQGFGELLAEGARAAAAATGGDAGALYTRSDPYDPRYCAVNTLLFPFETREPIQQLHEAGLVLSQWSSWAKGVDGAHISSSVARGIAERFWGGAEAADMTTLAGKARAAKRIQERQLAKEALGLCDWMFPVFDNPAGPDHVGDPTLESQVLSAVLGRQVAEAELLRLGERVFNLQRAILLREGHRARDDDFLPAAWHEQGIEEHVADPELLAPGPGGEIVSQLGRRIDRDAYLGLRDRYYRLRGWDVPSGLPAQDRLAALGLDDVAADLASRGLALPRARGIPWRSRLRHWRAARRARRRAEARPAEPTTERGASLSSERLQAVLAAEREKFIRPDIAPIFAGWNKTMEYHFGDLGQTYRVRFVDGLARPPERVDGRAPPAEIRYEMDSWVLAALASGELDGKNAYFKRLLRVKAPFGDMMKLQSLNGK